MKDHVPEPNDEPAAAPPPSTRDAPSPEPDVPPAEPVEDDDLEELAEDDDSKSKPVSSAPAPIDGTDSESNGPPSAPLNPFGFGRKSSNSFSGVIPVFGDASAAVGKRPFDAKQVASAASEAQENEKETSQSESQSQQQPPKPPTFGRGFLELSSFGSSSPTKKVTTPLFGTAFQQAKQNNPVVFSKRPSFQTSLSPSAPAFVPGATAHKQSTGKPVLFGSVKPVSFGASLPERKSEPMQEGTPETVKPTVTEGEFEKPKAANLFLSNPFAPAATVKTFLQAKEKASPMDVSASPEKKVPEISKPKSRKEWSRVFSGVNLLTFKPSAPDSKKGNVQKKEGFYKLVVYKDNRGVRVEVVRLDTSTEEIFLSWEVGAEVLKVNRIKGRPNHAALTRLGRVAPVEPSENDPVKVFAMFVSSDDCSKFLDIIHNPVEQVFDIPTTTQTASPFTKPTSVPVPGTATKPQSSIMNTNAPVPEPQKESSAPIIPSEPKEKKQEPATEISGTKEMKPEESRKEKLSEEKKDSEMEVDKAEQTEEQPSKMDAKAALALKKKLLLQRMNLAKSLKSGSKKSSAAQSPVKESERDTSETKKSDSAEGSDKSAKESPVPSKPPTATVTGTKRTAKEALDTEGSKKQKVTFAEPTKREAASKQNLTGAEFEELKNLRKQLAIMRQKHESSLSKSQTVERSLRTELSKKNNQVIKLQDEAKTLEEKVKETKQQRATANKVAYELAGLAKEMKSVVRGDAKAELDREALLACRPHSREDFFKRLWTFQPETWVGFSELGVLDPVECALHGWYNDGVNRLRSSDGATVKMDESKYYDVKTCDAEVRRVRKAITGGAHALLGGWRGNRCPDEFRTASLCAGEKAWTKRRVHGIVEITCIWCKRKTSMMEQEKAADEVGERFAHCAYVRNK